MHRFEEVAGNLQVLFCLKDESVENSSCYSMQRSFKQVSRCVPSLVYKRVKQHKYDILFIDKSVDLDESFVHSINSVKQYCPKTSIFAESEEDDAQRILEIIALNIDKLILTSMSPEVFRAQIERSLSLKFELELNSRYERHLEDIIFGKTQELEVQQHRDPLTGFPNATALKNCFSDNLNKAILYLDIDKFDTINTLYGMKIGDEVLKLVAKRLARYLPENTNIFRISADEFVILIHQPKKDQHRHLADQIISLFSESPIVTHDISFDIFFSIGRHLGSDYEICAHAKLANREAKFLGGKICVPYRSESHYLNVQKENHFWINEIKAALKEDRIVVYYQPIFDNVSKTIDKYEALVRLKSVSGEIITPNFFLKPAILSDLITSLSRVVIDKSFKMFSDNDHSFSFNLSDQDFAEGYLKEFLLYKCNYYNIKPERVYIEILEETSLKCSDDFLDQIHALRKAGFRFSIDDFGIENSNFSRAIELKAEIIKIDGSFIRGLAKDESSRIIVDSIVNFSKKIGAKTVAEFVEDEATLITLKELGVDYSQGYLIGKPNPKLMCSLY